MPQILPIRDLKDTNKLSKLVKEANEPVYITKNGYGDMVIMSMETYERAMYKDEVYRSLERNEQSIKDNDTMDAFDSLNEIKAKHGL